MSSTHVSPLQPEKLIVLSPQLAATIGLEEAVLFNILNDVCTFTSPISNTNQLWFEISQSQLGELLPFWNETELQRVAKSLSDKGVIVIDSAPIHHSRLLRFALHNASTEATTTTAIAPEKTRGANLISPSWVPDDDLLQVLTLNHGIPRQFALSQLEDFILYWQERQEISHSWPSKFRQHVIRQWRYTESENNPAQPTGINRDWQPSVDAVDILVKSGVNKEFLIDAIPEFILYWQERKDAGSNWNTRFIAHIRRQWASFRSATTHDTMPSIISPDWQPKTDVYDILQLANIDADFARTLIPEFILFWRDSNQAQRSWNTKFLQHVKYHWAKRLQLETSRTNRDEGQQATDQQSNQQPRTIRERSLTDDLTDRSWAR